MKKRVDGHDLLFVHPKVTGRSRGLVIAYQIRCQCRTPVVVRSHSLRHIGKNIRGCVGTSRIVGEEPELSHPRVAGCWWNHEDSLRLDRAGCRIIRRAAHPVDECFYSRGVAVGHWHRLIGGKPCDSGMVPQRLELGAVGVTKTVDGGVAPGAVPHVGNGKIHGLREAQPFEVGIGVERNERVTACRNRILLQQDLVVPPMN